MTKSHINYKWIDNFFQSQDFQSEIFMGHDKSQLQPMTVLINHFVNSINTSFFNQYYKSNRTTGGRPNVDNTILLKIYLYALYNDISIRHLQHFYSLGSDLYFLSSGLLNFPSKTTISDFLKILDKHIDEIFISSIEYLRCHIQLNTKYLYCDGTVFEANNSRNKVVTVGNINRSNKKWLAVVNDPNSTPEEKIKAEKKLLQNEQWSRKMVDLNRTSFGRIDEDCGLVKDKNNAYIAGYNAQIVEEHNHGFIVYPYLSNKNPDAKAFEDVIDPIYILYHPKFITLDTGYGTPEILKKLKEKNIKANVKALKNKYAKEKITEYSFTLSKKEDYLICPKGKRLKKRKEKDDGKTIFKKEDCKDCTDKINCSPKNKGKRVTVDVSELKLFNEAKKIEESKKGKEYYARRGNKCESPNGFIKYNLNGKKLKMRGLVRNNSILKLYSILYNLSRLISIKINEKQN